MKKNPLVSIIMPAYNVEKYIKVAIESVQNQSYSNWELIIINDGSTDSTLEIAKEYESKDSRITVHTQTNQKLGPSRNNGFKLSKGDYVYFMDSDDLLHSDLINICVFLAENHNIDILNFNFEMFNDSSPVSDIIDSDRLKVSFCNPKKAMLDLPPMSWTYFYRKNLLDKSGVNYPAIFHEDEIGTYPIFCFAKKIGRIDIPLYFYRRGIQSITSKKIEERYPHLLKLISLIIEQAEIYPDFKNEFIYRAWYFMYNFRREWNIIKEPWVRSAVQKLDELESSVLNLIDDNPYVFIEKRIIDRYEKSNTWKIGSLIRKIVNIFRFK